MGLKINEEAPLFKLYNTEKKEISLEDQRGKNVVLLFFPLAFTGTCTAELCNIRDNYAIYDSLNAVVFGISVDSLHSLKKFREEQKLNFDLLSDFNKEVSAMYGSLYETFSFGMKGVSKRSAFVIDPKGKIKYAEVLENASEQPDYSKIKASLEEIKELC
jgi:glutaredoxin-dependent peroxiredoxin